MKVCSRCKEEYNLSLFSSRGQGKKSPYCKECRKIIRKADYEKHKDYYIEDAKKVKQKRKEFIREQKNKPCTDCKQEYPYYIMEFDHLRDKDFILSTAFLGKGFETIKKEIEKCEVVCANCHRERTHQRTLL